VWRECETTFANSFERVAVSDFGGETPLLLYHALGRAGAVGGETGEMIQVKGRHGSFSHLRIETTITLIARNEQGHGSPLRAAEGGKVRWMNSR
jgi:hypothetical protein